MIIRSPYTPYSIYFRGTISCKLFEDFGAGLGMSGNMPSQCNPGPKSRTPVNLLPVLEWIPEWFEGQFICQHTFSRIHIWMSRGSSGQLCIHIPSCPIFVRPKLALKRMSQTQARSTHKTLDSKGDSPQTERPSTQERLLEKADYQQNPKLLNPKTHEPAPSPKPQTYPQSQPLPGLNSEVARSYTLSPDLRFWA